jgi:hypothetical protein
MENGTDNQKTRTKEGKGRIRSIIPKFLAMTLILSMVAALPVYSVAAASASPSAQCTPDFTVSGPTNVMVARGATLFIGITVTSVCGFTGNISWFPSVTAPPHTTQNGVGLHQATYHPIVLSATHTSGGASFSAITTANTLMTTWTITVTAYQQGTTLRHTVNISLRVDDFAITANPTIITTSVGTTVTPAVTATSLNGFSGQIFYSGLLSPYPVSPESCNLQPPQPTLGAGSSVISTLTCSFDAKGTYTMFETATPYAGVPSHNVTITFIVK